LKETPQILAKIVEVGIEAVPVGYWKKLLSACKAHNISEMSKIEQKLLMLYKVVHELSIKRNA